MLQKNDIQLIKLKFEKDYPLTDWKEEIKRICSLCEMPPVAFVNEISLFLIPFLEEVENYLRDVWSIDEFHNIDNFIEILQKYVQNHKEETKNLMNQMKVTHILFPYISLDLTATEIHYFNNLEVDDPQALTLMMENEEYRVMSSFIDYYDQKEVISFLIWSNKDQILFILPYLGLNPYPLCGFCKDKYGEKSCAGCGIGRYCCRECQLQDWSVPFGHKVFCGFLASYHQRSKCLSFDSI